MIQTVFQTPEFRWIDVESPTGDELLSLARDYELHPTSVRDCLDPGHLPKVERIEDIVFLIARCYDERCTDDADTMENLTRKVAIFTGEKFLITVHRAPLPWLTRLREKWAQSGPATDPAIVAAKLLCHIMERLLETFEGPIENAVRGLEKMETELFRHTSPLILEEAYYLRRKASVFKRMLRIQTDSIPRLYSVGHPSAPYYQDLKELTDALFFQADALLENVNQLLTLHLAIDSARTNEASQKTNEVVRILTIMSVFFMPLNLIAGIYGMNFRIFPGLDSPYGVPVSLAAMAAVTLAAYLWFKKQGWLK